MVPLTATAMAGFGTLVAPSSWPITIAGTFPLDGSIVVRLVGGLIVTPSELALLTPRTRADLLAVHGIGDTKAGRYGDGFLQLIARHGATS